MKQPVIFVKLFFSTFIRELFCKDFFSVFRTIIALCVLLSEEKSSRIRIRIYLLARRTLLWDILRLPSSCYRLCHSHAITSTGREPATLPYELLHRSSPHYALRHGDDSSVNKCRKNNF